MMTIDYVSVISCVRKQVCINNAIDVRHINGVVGVQECMFMAPNIAADPLD